MTSSSGGSSNSDAPEAVLRTVSRRAAGFDPDGLARVEQVVRGALDIVFPTAALLVARGGGVVLHGAYGFLDPEQRQRPAAKM